MCRMFLRITSTYLFEFIIPLIEKSGPAPDKLKEPQNIFGSDLLPDRNG